MTYGEKAKALFEEGYNCSQAVFLAFIDILPVSKLDAIRLSAGFGGGFGRMREVCGAVSAMTAVISYFNACENPNDKDKKAQLYEKIQSAIASFKSENGDFICKNLLGMADTSPTPQERTKQYYKKRPCGELCRCAADIAARMIGRAD